MSSLASMNINGWFKILAKFLLVCEQIMMKARVFKAKRDLATEQEENRVTKSDLEQRVG